MTLDKSCAEPLITEISFVIPTFNRPFALVDCLKSLFSQKTHVGFEIIVSLDSRDDVSETFMDRNSQRISIVRAARPGVNAARNRGIAVAQGNLIVFIDDDCLILRQDWIDLLSARFRQYPDAFAIGGGYISYENAPLFVRCRNRMNNAYVFDSRVSEVEVRSLLGGNSAYRKEVFAHSGFFDEFLRYGAAETELNERISAAGGKLYFFDELSVIHVMNCRSLYQHCRRVFFQGRGRAYSHSKGNKCVYSGRGAKATMRYLCAVVNEERYLCKKAGAFFFIVLNAIFFRIGFYWGRIIYNCL